jgi:hypothetical protein
VRAEHLLIGHDGRQEDEHDRQQEDRPDRDQERMVRYRQQEPPAANLGWERAARDAGGGTRRGGTSDGRGGYRNPPW